MKIFNKDGAWNFVDVNNVVVGYRKEQDCCESAGYFFTFGKLADFSEGPKRCEEEFREHLGGGLSHVTGEPRTDCGLLPLPDATVLDAYNFDPEFFEYLPDANHNLDAGKAAMFRLVLEGAPDLYLVLYNMHNGYYSHGFELSVGGVSRREDYL